MRKRNKSLKKSGGARGGTDTYDTYAKTKKYKITVLGKSGLVCCNQEMEVNLIDSVFECLICEDYIFFDLENLK